MPVVEVFTDEPTSSKRLPDRTPVRMTVAVNPDSRSAHRTMRAIFTSKTRRSGKPEALILPCLELSRPMMPVQTGAPRPPHDAAQETRAMAQIGTFTAKDGKLYRHHPHHDINVKAQLVPTRTRARQGSDGAT